MGERADYTMIVRKRLEKYNRYKIAIKNLAAQIAAYSENPAPPIAQYGNSPGGGSGELNSVEAAASRLIKAQSYVERLVLEKKNIELIVEQIDAALLGLSDQERHIVRGYYLEDKPWAKLATDCGYSTDWVRHKSGQAIKKMGEMIFGGREIIVQGGFYFVV